MGTNLEAKVDRAAKYRSGLAGLSMGAHDWNSSGSAGLNCWALSELCGKPRTRPAGSALGHS